MHRFALMPLLLLGITGIAYAQTIEPTPAQPRDSQSADASVVLEMRWLTLNDNGAERIGISEFKRLLPERGRCTVCDQQQAEFVINVGAGDRRSWSGQGPTITLRSGECKRWVPTWITGADRTDYAIRATVLDNSRAVAMQMTWGKSPDGTDVLPVMTTLVPSGSHLLVHTSDLMIEAKNSFSTAPSHWDQLLDRILNRQSKNIGIGKELQQGFLLVTPHIVPAGGQPGQLVAR